MISIHDKLSPHFTVRELCKSNFAIRHGIDNTPPPVIVENLKLLCESILEPIREHYAVPIVPSSGYRSIALNTLMPGSSSTSQHIFGQAVDLEINGIDNFDLAVWIANFLNFDQLILEHYTPGDPSSGWVHVSYKMEGNRKQIKTFDGHSYRSGLISGGGIGPIESKNIRTGNL